MKKIIFLTLINFFTAMYTMQEVVQVAQLLNAVPYDKVPSEVLKSLKKSPDLNEETAQRVQELLNKSDELDEKFNKSLIKFKKDRQKTWESFKEYLIRKINKTKYELRHS